MKIAVFVFSLTLLPAVLTAGLITSAAANIDGASASQTGTSNAEAKMGGVRGSAGASYGSVSATTYANCGFVSSCSATAKASFEDSIYILDASGILQARAAYGGFYLDGNFASGHGTLGTDAFFFSISSYGPLPIGPRNVSTTFSQGEPIVIEGHVSAGAYDFEPWSPNYGSSDAALSLSFTKFVVLGPGGAPISGFTYTSASYHDYGIAGGTFVAPEPGTSWMMLAGAVIVFVFRSRRRLFAQR